MNESFSLLKQDLIRVFTIQLIPGFICIWPYLHYVLLDNYSTYEFLIKNKEFLILLLIAISYSAGMILEEIGNRIEHNICDRIVKKNIYKEEIKKLKKNKTHNECDLKKIKEDSNATFENTWNKFLELQYENNVTPVGHRVLRNIVLRFKFELSMGVALLFFAIGLLILKEKAVFTFRYIYIITPLILSMYLIFYESCRSSNVLHEIRAQLVLKYHK